ncbi:MAG: response regulator transcription factor [Sphingobacteriia bacterium]|nr:response regulator transcription factor [Sphingobacteriia bacterium]
MVKHKINILISDGQSVYRTGLKHVLEQKPNMGTITEARNEIEMISLARTDLPDVVVISINFPQSDGIAAIKELFAALPESRVVALASSPRDEGIRQMVELGALGHVTKFADVDEIHEAIKAVYKREPYFCAESADRFYEMITRKNPDPSTVKHQFSTRELDIIRLICKELTSKEISEELHLSKRTVEGHRTRIMNKTGAKGIAGIILYAVEHNIYQHSK